MNKIKNKQLKYKTMLVTGGAGFVGSNLAVSFKKKYSSLNVLSLDNLKRRGSELNIKRLKENNIEFIHGDIRNPEDLEFKCKIDLLLECSAEPSVLAGYGESPAYLINTNLVGTINCLELARKNNSDVIFLSTSRVYPYGAINCIKTNEMRTRFEWSSEQVQNIPGWSTKGIDVDFTTNGPKSMYGATKLCSEVILQEYMQMYGLKAVINRCGVIAGPWQFGKVDQGVFTLWMLAHYFKRPLKYIGFGGKGKQVRDLLHIEDVFDLIELQLEKINDISGNVFNVGGGGNVNLSLLETTRLCEQITPKTRPADLAIYITDNEKVTSTCKWRPNKNAESILKDIFAWIKNNEKVLYNIL